MSIQHMLCAHMPSQYKLSCYGSDKTYVNVLISYGSLYLHIELFEKDKRIASVAVSDGKHVVALEHLAPYRWSIQRIVPNINEAARLLEAGKLEASVQTLCASETCGTLSIY